MSLGIVQWVEHLSQVVLQDQVILLDKEGRKEMFYLMMHSTHFIYGYMVSDIW